MTLTTKFYRLLLLTLVCLDFKFNPANKYCKYDKYKDTFLNSFFDMTGF